eukprot:890368-Prorocentrum_minimum.AAC.4
MGEGALRSYVVSHRDSTERHFVLCVGSSLCQQRQGSFLCQQRQGCAFGTLRRAKGSGGDEAKGPTIGLRTGPTPCAPGHMWVWGLRRRSLRDRRVRGSGAGSNVSRRYERGGSRYRHKYAMTGFVTRRPKPEGARPRGWIKTKLNSCVDRSVAEGETLNFSSVCGPAAEADRRTVSLGVALEASHGGRSSLDALGFTSFDFASSASLSFFLSCHPARSGTEMDVMG